MANLRKQIEATLTPQQWASCKEMAFQNLAIPGLLRALRRADGRSASAQKASGIQAFGELMEQAFSGLGLTAQQIAALRKIDAEYSDKAEQVYCELTDKALAAFTPAQREQLRAEVDRRGW